MKNALLRGLIDCGRVSKMTRGVPLLLIFELGTPPTNRLYYLG